MGDQGTENRIRTLDDRLKVHSLCTRGARCNCVVFFKAKFATEHTTLTLRVCDSALMNAVQDRVTHCFELSNPLQKRDFQVKIGNVNNLHQVILCIKQIKISRRRKCLNIDSPSFLTRTFILIATGPYLVILLSSSGDVLR